MTFSHDAIACIGEFTGTFMFLFLSLGGAKTAIMAQHDYLVSTGQSNVLVTDPQTLVYISLSFGLSLVVTAWIFFRISGSLFNPAISFALFLAGALGWKRCILLVAAQFAGGMAASGLVEALTPNFGNAGVTTLAEGLSPVQGLFLEAILTAALIFSVFMLAAEKHRATHLAPVGIGLTLFVCHLFSVRWTGAGLNPARALGPSVVHRDFPSYHWIYYVGPFIGSLFAVTFYLGLKACDYSKVVLGQDADHCEGPGAISVPFSLYGKARGASFINRKRGNNEAVFQLPDGALAVQIPTDMTTNAATSDGKASSDMESQAHPDPHAAANMSRGPSYLRVHIPEMSRAGTRMSRNSTTGNAQTVVDGDGNAFLVVANAIPEQPDAQDTGAILQPGTTGEGLAGVDAIRQALST